MNDEFDFDHTPVAPEDLGAAPAEPIIPAEPPAAPAGETPAPSVWQAPAAPEPPKPSAYSDAGYVPSGAAPTTPRSYYCNAPAPDKKEKKQKKQRRGVHWAAVVALCLACVLLGGAVVYGLPLATEHIRQTGLFGRSPAPERTPAPTQAPAAPVEDGAPTSTINKVAPVKGGALTTSTVAPGAELSATEIYYDMALKQVVGVTTEITYTNYFGYTSSGAVIGSGFIISDDGYLLTNYHVIDDAVKGGYTVNVLDYDGNKYEAAIVGYESENDVAVLKIDGSFHAAVIGDSDAMRVGETVYAVGNPTGELEYTMTDGMVCALDREITTGNKSTGVSQTINMFQISAAINEGNSGGPVYNSRGEVIGISTAKYSATGVEGLGFAIPINDAIKIANDLITDGYVRGKAAMGITVGTVSSSAAQYYGLVEGAIVGSVNPGSCAEKAGLRENDIIVALGGADITSRDQLIKAKRDYRAGDTAVLKVYRGGEYLELTITFDEATPVAPETETTQPAAGTPAEEQGPQPGNGGYGSYYDFFNEFFGGFPFGGRQN